MTDVDMKLADEKDDSKKTEEKKIEEKKELTAVDEVKSNIALIERAVSTLEPRFTHRVLRTLTSLRKRIDDAVLRDTIEAVYTTGALLLTLHPFFESEDRLVIQTLL